MLRRTILALGLASAAAENCGGSLSLDPRYCVGTVDNDGVTRYCDSTAILEGDIVPLRIRVTNNANYENLDADSIYVPAQLVGGKTMQIVFACIEACTNPDGIVETCTDANIATKTPASNCKKALGDILAQDTRPPEWDDDLKKAVGPVYDGQPAKFEMGACPSTFAGVQHCDDTGVDEPDTMCGCITISETNKNIPLAGDETIDIGMIFMKATRYYDEGSFVVHVSADQGILQTVGGVCTPDELTASGSGTAQAEYNWYPPPPPPPPPPSPPPKSANEAACVVYNQCHFCEDIASSMSNPCLYYGVHPGDSNFECISSCDALKAKLAGCDTTNKGLNQEDPYKPNFCWIFGRRWGSCSSLCPVSVSKDPHLHLPHGGRADFRGKDNTVFNLLSAKDVSLNVRFAADDFAWAKRLVHGTKMAAAYWTIRTESGKVLTIEFKSVKFDPVAVVREKGHRDVEVRPGQPAVVVEDVQVAMLSAKALTVVNKKWRFSAISSPFPFGKKEANKDKVLLDVAIQPLYEVEADVVAPHGIIGQAYDGDTIAVSGKLDADRSGETTTTAQAEGAIEGTWEDYIMETPFATDYKFSRFDATAAPHRDVSKLTGEKKAASTTAIAGATDAGATDAPRTIAA